MKDKEVLTFVLPVVLFYQILLSLDRFQFLLIPLNLDLFLKQVNLIPNLMFGCTLYSLIPVVPLIPLIESPIECLYLVRGLFHSSQRWNV